MPKVLITGASGLLGRAILRHFNQAGWATLGLAFSRAKEPLKKVDLTNKEEVRAVFENFKPDVVVHSAAERRPNKVEEDLEQSHRLNVDSSAHIAALAKESKAGLIFISTDYAFDGSNPPYAEDAPPNPINTYGKTKVAAEKVIIETYPEGSSILRVPVLYGDEEYLGESAVSVLAKLLLSPQPGSVSSYELRFPSHTSDVATVCLQLASRCVQDGGDTIRGIYHWCGDEGLTKWDMVQLMGTEFGKSTAHLTPCATPSPDVPRPRDTQLQRSRLEALGIGQHTPFQQGVRSTLAPFLLPAN
ncbi:MAT2B [Cordylochernes scorpioides]|uniref:Methionine adenosyltransferase 2 subunit beta n=1 Tax=Cordylochernes scorpioides TaxID=51811 RepID=A0ABY6LHQ6_9ARAC|nr:MAT2B [Cordylochernes scorpioides]